MNSKEVMKDLELQILDMNTELEAVRIRYQEQSRQTMMKIFKTFFDLYPDVKSIGWTQYTPYFNDGEECVFRCGVEYAWASNYEKLDFDSWQWGELEVDEEVEGLWVDDPDYGEHGEELIPVEITKALDDLRSMLAKIEDETFKQVFGDHVKVVATRGGFKVSDHDHD